jgi:hypothetical protein
MAMRLDGEKTESGAGLKTSEYKPQREGWKVPYGTTMEERRNTHKSDRGTAGAEQMLNRSRGRDSNNSHEAGVVSKTKPTHDTVIG